MYIVLHIEKWKRTADMHIVLHIEKWKRTAEMHIVWHIEKWKQTRDMHIVLHIEKWKQTRDMHIVFHAYRFVCISFISFISFFPNDMYIVHIVSISFWKRYVYRSYRFISFISFSSEQKNKLVFRIFSRSGNVRENTCFQYFEHNRGIGSFMFWADSLLFSCWELPVGSRVASYENTNAFVKFRVQDEVTKT